MRRLLTFDNESAPSKTDVSDTEDALLAFAQSVAKTPPLGLKDKILAKINALNAQAENRTRFSLHNLPLLTPQSNWLDWQEAVKNIVPEEDFENIYLHNLESNDTRDLFVAWVKEFIPEEVHYDLLESFILLEGTCECFITGEDGSNHVVRMQAGDFIEMKLGETHDIKITSPEPAKAILQWLKIAA